MCLHGGRTEKADYGARGTGRRPRTCGDVHCLTGVGRGGVSETASPSSAGSECLSPLPPDSVEAPVSPGGRASGLCSPGRPASPGVLSGPLPSASCLEGRGTVARSRAREAQGVTVHGGCGFGAGREAAPRALVQQRTGPGAAGNRSEPGGPLWLACERCCPGPRPRRGNPLLPPRCLPVPALDSRTPSAGRLPTPEGWTSIFSLPGETLTQHGIRFSCGSS